MRGLPEELIFLLVIGLIWLAQFVRQRQRRQAPTTTEAERTEALVDAAAEPPAPATRPPAFVPNLAEGPRRAPPPRDRHAPASATPAQASARRYSRRALMGNRRAVQNALVTAAILQPCRAHRPHGVD